MNENNKGVVEKSSLEHKDDEKQDLGSNVAKKNVNNSNETQEQEYLEKYKYRAIRMLEKLNLDQEGNDVSNIPILLKKKKGENIKDVFKMLGKRNDLEARIFETQIKRNVNLIRDPSEEEVEEGEVEKKEEEEDKEKLEEELSHLRKLMEERQTNFENNRRLSLVRLKEKRETEEKLAAQLAEERMTSKSNNMKKVKKRKKGSIFKKLLGGKKKHQVKSPKKLLKKKGGITGFIKNKMISSEEEIGSSFMDEFDMVLRAEREKAERDIAKIKINEKLFEVKFEQIKVLESVGRGGSNSIVFHCNWKDLDVAFKCFQTKELLGSQSVYDDFEREVNIMSSIRHPACVSFYGCCLHPPRVGIVMEYCSNGDLKCFIEKNEEYPIKDRFRILIEVCGGMDYLHDRNVIHRDVKSENILLNENKSAKIMDFGTSRILEGVKTISLTNSVGTSYYMAPEILKCKSYTNKVDVFSFAMVCYEVLSSNFRPFPKNILHPEFKVANDPSFRPQMDNLPIGLAGNKCLEKMMNVAWNHDPDKRPTFLELKALVNITLVEFNQICDGEFDE